jgi:hypothetical protein
MKTPLLTRVDSAIHRIAGVVTFQEPIHRFSRWLDHKLKIDVYELRGEEIIAGRGRGRGQRIRVSDILSWQIHMEMGMDFIVIDLNDRRSVTWVDEYDDLIAILRQVAPDKEQPWTYA